MNTGFFEFTVAVTLLVATVALVLAYRGYLRAGSARRLTRMLRRIGLDPALMSRDDLMAKATVEEIWKRCRKCQAESYCERWLDGEVGSDISFCPNVPTFLQLKHS